MTLRNACFSWWRSICVAAALIAGSLLSAGVAVLIGALYYLSHLVFGFAMSEYFMACVVMALINELSNLLLPIKFGKYKTDSWIAIESFIEWLRYDSKSTKTRV